MGLFSRSTSDELRTEAKQVESYITSAARMQAASGEPGYMGDDNVIAGYQHRLNEINQELKSRS